ncbi:Amidase family protein [Pleurostoma richardsiae]|uniref:Amidase family protein n=1 Tax=Pleurostoma richardsiae TaxID=41990 RepID=A0AA38VGY7_9PEZI|nr:Amidase family protein [Pleurostoma richardsiae]
MRVLRFSLLPGILSSLAWASPVTVKSIAGDGTAFTFTLASDNGTALGAPTQYYVPSAGKTAPVAVYQNVAWKYKAPADGSLLPFTVFATDAVTVTGALLDDLYVTYLEDDVYAEGFLDGLMLSTPNANILDATAAAWIAKKGVSALVKPAGLSMPGACDLYPFTVISVPSMAIVPGPYLASMSADDGSCSFSLSKVYALFVDLQEAFMSSFTANDDGSFSYANLWDAAQYGLLVPVPSKLYHSTLDKIRYPLAGLRFAVKDLMPIAGILTSGGSREMLRLYDTPDENTAPAIQQLLDLGAVPIGKTKLTVFAFGAWPYQTDDFPYSWNPRADGYLGLSASSYGSAAAISAYDALDFTIGSDTLGSVRNPADRVGVYGLRPTWGVMNLTDVIPSASSLDTLGLFARSPGLLAKVAKAWDTDSNPALQTGNFLLPKKIIFPSDFFPVNNSVAQSVINNWLSNVSAALNMTIEKQNVTELFLSNVDKSDTLSNYTSTISSMTSYDNYNLFGKAFISDYYAKFDHYPELDIAAFSAWETAPDLTVASKEASEQRRHDFEDFVNTHVIPFDAETCSEGFWVYHISDTGGGVPEYRDVLTYDYFPTFKPMRGASIAPYAKLVDVTVPIGSITYDSIISKREEPLVITLNIVAHKGCDFVLMDFLSACAEAGLCKDVTTGRFAFQ